MIAVPTTLHVNADTMRTVMSAPFEWFAELGEVREGKVGRLSRATTARHIYIDRGADVLGVAHLDSVCGFTSFWLNREYVCCPTLDNRLGAWLMLYALPELGIHFDVLLCENEEMGQSTAQDFVPSKHYNWGFSFDRGGTDVACYQYYDRELDDLLAEYDLVANLGSYSDIAELDLGVKCMNFGCGMSHYHSEYAYTRLSDLALMVRRFQAFYTDHATTRLDHTGRGRGKWWEDDSYWDEHYYVDGKGEYSDDREWLDYRRTGYALTYPITKSSTSWDYIDRWHANDATEHPATWFEGFTDPDEWHLNHSLGDINQLDPDDEVASIYFDGVLDMCANCENLFVKGDVDRYHSLDMTLCKACFYSMAIDEGFPRT